MATSTASTTSLPEEHRTIDTEVSSSSDDEYYYEYEVVDDNTVEEDSKQPETLIVNQKYKRLYVGLPLLFYYVFWVELV